MLKNIDVGNFPIIAFAASPTPSLPNKNAHAIAKKPALILSFCEAKTMHTIRTRKIISAVNGDMSFSFPKNVKMIMQPYVAVSNISKTKQKILESLEENEQTAILISKKVGISRAMTYKHLNDLMEEGLVKQTKRYEKYYLTNAGRIAII